MNKNLRGFSVIELVLAIALLGTLFGASVLAYENAPFRDELSVAVESSRSLLERAKQQAAASTEDSAWGVAFEDGSAVLFKGETFLGRDAAFDVRILLPIESSGTSEYVFEKLRARPQSAGTTTFTSPATEEEMTLTVNAYGRIEKN